MKSAMEAAERESRRARSELAAGIAGAEAEATKKGDRESARLRFALSAADDHLRLALAELKQLRAESERELAIQRDSREEAERLLQDEVEQHSHEADDLRAQLAGVVKETTDVKTSIRKGAEASSKNTLERAQAEVQRVRLDMEELEDERFELRRALEAHVGALVEAKVDNAEYQGTILELRKELSRVKVKYQRAAARCTKLEAMYYTLKDARDPGAVIEVTAKAARS